MPDTTTDQPMVPPVLSVPQTDAQAQQEFLRYQELQRIKDDIDIEESILDEAIHIATAFAGGDYSATAEIRRARDYIRDARTALNRPGTSINIPELRQQLEQIRQSVNAVTAFADGVAQTADVHRRIEAQSHTVSTGGRARIRRLNHVLLGVEVGSPGYYQQSADLADVLADGDPERAAIIHRELQTPDGVAIVSRAQTIATREPRAAAAVTQREQTDLEVLQEMLRDPQLSQAKRAVIEDIINPQHRYYTGTYGHRLVTLLNDGSEDISPAARQQYDRVKEHRTRVSQATGISSGELLAFADTTIAQYIEAYRGGNRNYTQEQLAQLQILNNPASTPEQFTEASVRLLRTADTSSLSPQQQAALRTQEGQQALRSAVSANLQDPSSHMAQIFAAIRTDSRTVRTESEQATRYWTPWGWKTTGEMYDGAMRMSGESRIEHEFRGVADILNRRDPQLAAELGFSAGGLNKQNMIDALVREGIIRPRSAFPNTDAGRDAWAEDCIHRLNSDRSNDNGHEQLGAEEVLVALRRAADSRLRRQITQGELDHLEGLGWTHMMYTGADRRQHSVFDQNGDNQITIDEIRTALRTANVNLADFDANHDGRLSGGELTTAMRYAAEHHYHAAYVAPAATPQPPAPRGTTR